MLQNTMKFSNYSELGCLLKKVGQAIQDYLGKNFFNPFLWISLLTGFLVTDNGRDRPNFHSPIFLLEMYLDFIHQRLLPEIERLTSKYAVWWSFKPTSPLKEFLEKYHYKFEDYFLPSTLVDTLCQIIENQYMLIEGNSTLVIPDKELQSCFPAWMFLKKDLMYHCADHIIVASQETSTRLQNENIAKDFYVSSPINLLFQDSTSKFWVHPLLNTLLNQNAQVAYSWNDLHFLFLDFCTTNSDHFSRVNENIISIHPDSELFELFRFNYFHLDQCDDILKQAIFFLGRTNTLQKLWKHKTFNGISEKEVNEVCSFIDDVINSNHHLSAQSYISAIQL